MRSTIVGCSHIYFLKERNLENWMNSPFWHYPSIEGCNSMPIFHEKFIKMCQERSGKYKNIYIFPLRSIAFNTITDWMEVGLNNRNYNHQMNHDIYLSAFKNAENWYVSKDLIKNEHVINIQNQFYQMWIDWYIENIQNVKFVFWCHFGTQHERGKFPPHLCYNDLYEKYQSHAVNLNNFKEMYDMKNVFRDGDFHPTDYGFECLRNFLETR